METAWVGALIWDGMIGSWALCLIVGSIILLICRLWAFWRKIDSSFVMVARFERMVALSVIVVLPWPIVAQLIYMVVVIGTFISSLQIIYQILKSNPVVDLGKPRS